MAALNFPTGPSVNQIHTENGYSWKWDGVAWRALSAIGYSGFSGYSGSLALAAVPADVSYSGLTVTVTYGESLVPGDIVYFKSDGTVMKADANGTGTYPAIGLALETAASGSHLILLHGVYRDDTRYSWTVGGTVFLSTTAGDATQTAPSATDEVIQVLGTALHADRLYFTPSPDYITHT